MKPARPVRFPLWKKVVFAVLACALVLAVLEGVLALCGVRPVLRTKDPYVGFSSRIPLFVERALPDGRQEMRTADNKLDLFNPQHFLREKPAGTFRIFCLGGSTTYGRPYTDTTSFCGWLRELLPAVDPSRHWEVINAGGVSYASYRVSVLMEELVRYEPDLFVVYTGQNEFLERRTYARILATPGSIRDVSAVVSRTRTWAALQALIQAVTPEAQPETTPATELPGEVEAMLDRSVGPDAYARDDALRSQVLAHFRYSLSRIVDIARSANAGLLFITPASNLRDCSPFKSENSASLTAGDRQRWQAALQQAQEALRDNRVEDGLAALDQAAQIDERHAGLHFMRARAMDALGRFDQAKTAYQRALEEDVCPLRALAALRSIVSEIAIQRDVPLVDFATLVEDRSRDGIPGKELFLDHVHPTIEMHRALALAIIEALVNQRYAQPRSSLRQPWENDVQIQQAVQVVESRIDRQTHAIALKNLAKVMSWAGKHEESYQAAARALELSPDDSEVQYQLARAALFLGRLTQAEQVFRQMLQVELEPGAAPIYFADAHLDLGKLCEMQGLLDQAEEHYARAVQLRPDYAPGHNNLGVFYKRRGDLERAEVEYRAALSIQPEFPEACLNLGILLEERGARQEAAAQYRRALQLRPGYPTASRRLEQLLQNERAP